MRRRSNLRISLLTFIVIYYECGTVEKNQKKKTNDRSPLHDRKVVFFLNCLFFKVTFFPSGQVKKLVSKSVCDKNARVDLRLVW